MKNDSVFAIIFTFVAVVLCTAFFAIGWGFGYDRSSRHDTEDIVVSGVYDSQFVGREYLIKLISEAPNDVTIMLVEH